MRIKYSTALSMAVAKAVQDGKVSQNNLVLLADLGNKTAKAMLRKLKKTR